MTINTEHLSAQLIEKRQEAISGELYTLRVKEREIQRRIRALADEDMTLANALVEKWGPDATAEQLLSFGGTTAVANMVQERLRALAPSYRLHRDGFHVEQREGKNVPTGFVFGVHVARDTDFPHMAESLIAVADAFRIGEDDVHFRLYFRAADGMDSGVENDKTAIELQVQTGDKAETVMYGRRNGTAIATGDVAGVLAATAEAVYTDDL